MGIDGLRRESITFINATLTLKGCRVHRRSRKGNDCPCGEVHEEGDPRLGAPLRPERIDYDALIRANAALPKLFGGTVSKLREDLDEKLSTLPTAIELDYFGAYEPHASLARHIHVVFRLSEGLDQLQRHGLNMDESVQLFQKAILGMKVKVTTGGKSAHYSWGTDLDLKVVPPEKVSIAYILKSTGERPAHPRWGDRTEYGEHVRRAHEAAHGLIEDELRLGVIDPDTARKRRFNTEAGFTGRVVIKSRGWTPLTRTKLKERRADYATAAARELADPVSA